MTTYTDMHDADLAKIDAAEAQDVLTARGRAAQQIRLVLARMYGRGGMSTAEQWQVIPHLTDTGTIGVVDVSKGTAWDSRVDALPDVEALGLADGVYAAANVPAGGGTVAFDGEVVQRHGTAVVDGEVVAPTAPAGWRQILLPTWRGYDPDAGRYADVPVHLYAPDSWIRPTFIAGGLMTCYGRPGAPRSDYDAAGLYDGRYLDSTAGWGSKWPHGLPEWIAGESVTVLDTIADLAPLPIEGVKSLRRTRLAREDDAGEAARLAPLLDITGQRAAERLREDARSIPRLIDPRTRGQVTLDYQWQLDALTAIDTADLLDAADQVETTGTLDPDHPALSHLRSAEKAARVGWDATRLLRGLIAARRALDDGLPGAPWVAAHKLAREISHRVHSLYRDTWPRSDGEEKQ